MTANLLRNENHIQTGVVAFSDFNLLYFYLISNRLFPHAHNERYAFLAVTRSVGALTRLIFVAVVLFSVSSQMAVGTDPLKNAFTEN